MDQFVKKVFENNRNWVQDQLSADPKYFSRLVSTHEPDMLWIGCSDARVPANEITGTQPGEVFVHRNISNMVVHTDMNLLSVLSYAVEVLKVRHIIVCGHYGCGGIQAAFSNKSFGIIDNWLRHIKDVYRKHHAELEVIVSEEKRLKRLVELNVREQVLNLCKTSIVQTAWQEEKFLQVHGWVYDIQDGVLHNLEVTAESNEGLQSIYKFDSH